jgi:hypothetical protein
MSCVLSAIRRGSGCAAIAACVGAEFDPAPEACQRFCAERFQCDPEEDAFLCERTRGNRYSGSLCRVG